MRFKGVGFIMLAAVCWGISGAIGDYLINKGWDPIVVSFYRGSIGLICFIIWFFLHPKKNSIAAPRFFLWSILAGAGVAGNFAFYFVSIEASGVAVAVTLMYTAPVFVLLISIIRGLERSTWFKWGCIFLVFFGIVLLTGAYNPDNLEGSLGGIAGGIGAGLSYTLFIFGFKNASAFGKAPTTLSVAFFTFCLILFAVMDKGEAIEIFRSDDLWWVILLGIVGAGVSFVLYVIGIRKTPPSSASMVAMVEPVTASLLGVWLLGNHIQSVQLAGMFLILVTTTIYSVKQIDLKNPR